MIPLIVLVVAASAGLIAGIVFAVARRLIGPGRRRPIQVHEMDRESVLLDSSADTRHDGEFGLWLNDGRDHALIGEVIADLGATVRRRVIALPTSLSSVPMHGIWTGHVFPNPAAISESATEIQIATALGPAPAWEIRRDSDVWVIHIHGLRTTRITALRSVPAAEAIGANSLVPSFRGDGEAPDVPKGLSSLGQEEWQDIDAAIQYAVAEGGRRIILVGWSMGAVPALLANEQAAQRNRIDSLVLISPVTKWRSVIMHNVKTAHLPRWIGSAVIWALQNRVMSGLIGLRQPIGVDGLNWIDERPLTVPTLVIHSEGDDEVPFRLSQQFAAAHAGLVYLAKTPPAAHGWGYNVDAQGQTRLIASWLTHRGLSN